MKPDDKFPTERLESVRRLTAEAGDALDALTSAINSLRDDYPMFMHETTCDWWCFAANAKSYVRRIAEQTKKAVDGGHNPGGAE